MFSNDYWEHPLIAALFHYVYRGTELTEEEKEAIGTAFAAETNKRDEDAEM